MIRLSDVRLVAPRPSPHGRSELLGGVSLDIRSGEYVLLTGPNGAGKTLLLQVVAGLRAATAGSIEFGHTNGSPDIGIVFQSPDDQIVGSTVERDLAFGLENRAVPPPEIRRRVDEALSDSGLGPLAGRPPHLLSEGEKQRLALASAMILEPAILLLDEPTARLDPIARRRFLERVTRIREQRETTILHVAHRLGDAPLADRVIVLREGKIGLDVPPCELQDPERARECGLLPKRRTIASVDPPLEGTGARDFESSPERPIVRGDSLSLDTEFGGRVLHDVTAELRAGERVGIVGRSGAGKTTLVSILAGLLDPSAGQIHYHDDDRSVVGLVFQDPERAFFEATVLDDVAFGARNRGLSPDEARAAAAAALHRVGLDPETIGPRLPETLSGGEARRAAIAGILAFRPRAVLFDEPTTGLDAEGLDRFREVLGRLTSEDVAVALVSHDLSLITEECERVLVLDGGRLTWEGSAARLAEGLPPEWTAATESP